MTTRHRTDLRPAAGWIRLAPQWRAQPSMARERGGGYDAGGDGDGAADDQGDGATDGHGNRATTGHGDRVANGHGNRGAAPDDDRDRGASGADDLGDAAAADGPAPVRGAPEHVRDAAGELVRAARRLAELAATDSRIEGGELGALRSTLAALDVAQAAAVELTAQVQRRGSAERSAGLPLEHLLALETRLTSPDRRMLQSCAEILRTMPHLARAFRLGHVGWAEVRSIVCEVRSLRVADRAEIDDGFAELSNIERRDADRLVDEVRDAVAALRPEAEAKDTARTIERRFLALQPMLGGAGGTGYFELDDEGFAIVAEGLEAAMPPPSAGPRDVTEDAIGHGDPDEHETETADGDPALCDPVADRSRARQRADALVVLAETFLAGARPDGTLRRARPRLQALVDLTQAADPDGPVGWLLPPTVGARPAITAEALRRLASDADIQLVITDRDQIVGVTAPTTNIPARVRAAVQARDRGCRFPGCRLPVAFTDCHHVVPREDEGPTVVSNLVALCRRHHTAVTEGRWQLDMTPEGTVTVQRGRRKATSDPPATTLFRHGARPRATHDLSGRADGDLSDSSDLPERSDPPDGSDPPNRGGSPDGSDPPNRGGSPDGSDPPG